MRLTIHWDQASRSVWSTQSSHWIGENTTAGKRLIEQLQRVVQAAESPWEVSISQHSVKANQIKGGKPINQIDWWFDQENVWDTERLDWESIYNPAGFERLDRLEAIIAHFTPDGLTRCQELRREHRCE